MSSPGFLRNLEMVIWLSGYLGAVMKDHSNYLCYKCHWLCVKVIGYMKIIHLSSNIDAEYERPLVVNEFPVKLEIHLLFLSSPLIWERRAHLQFVAMCFLRRCVCVSVRAQLRTKTEMFVLEGSLFHSRRLPVFPRILLSYICLFCPLALVLLCAQLSLLTHFFVFSASSF